MTDLEMKEAIEQWGKNQWGEYYSDPTEEDLSLMISLIQFVVTYVPIKG